METNTPNGQRKRKKQNREIMEWTRTVLFALVFAILLRVFVFEFVVVEQSSMYPTLQENDKLCVLKVVYLVSDAKRGDIVVLKISETKNYVKRIIGLPGQSIEVKDSRVYINDERIDEDYLSQDLEYSDYPKTQIPENFYFVMGDNRVYSIDSRNPTIGFIDEDDLIGKVIFRIKPFTWF